MVKIDYDTENNNVIMCFSKELAEDIGNAVFDRISYHADGIKDGVEIKEAANTILELHTIIRRLEEIFPDIDISH